MKPGLALGIALVASVASAQYTNQTAPFYLRLIYDQAKYDSTLETSCHQGAAIGGLCAFVETLENVTLSGSTFQFNASSYDSDNGAPSTGYLTHELVGADFNGGWDMLLPLPWAATAGWPFGSADC